MKRFLLILLVWIPPFFCIAQEDRTEIDGYIGGYPYIDMGLPSGTLWAVHNIGASDEYECGDFYAWGETEPKELYDWWTYKFFVGVTDEYEPIVENIGDCISGTQYDAATVNWGNGWCMPDSTQLREIHHYTFGKIVTENGIEGIRVYSKIKEGKSFFLGYFGHGYEGGATLPGGYYWSGHEEYTYSGNSTSLFATNILIQLYSNQIGWSSRAYKYGGLNIRPVIKKRNAGVESIEGIHSGNIILSLTSKVIKFSRQITGCCEFRDITGRLLSSTDITDCECQIPGLPSGMYIVTVKEGNSTLLSKKLMIK